MALLGGGIAAVLAALLGAPAGAAVVAGLAGALAGWLIRRPEAEPSPSLPVEPVPAPPSGNVLPDILDAIDDPMLVVAGQSVVHANAAARAVLGQHIVGEDVRLAIRHPAATERLTRGAPYAEPVELIGIGERDRHWELRVHPIGALGLLVRLSDRTGAHTTERMRVDFVANASHELRTPLAALLGFIETLADANAEEDAPTRARFLGIMLGEAKRMQRLVDDLMSLSRIEAEKYSVPQTALRLEPLIEEVRCSLAAHPDDQKRLHIEAAEGTPPVAGDRAQLSQLLHNIVGNAIKYGREGTPVRIAISAAPNDMARLAVSDESEGIPPEHLPRLTERFYRVDPGRSRSLGGTGLGLSIVKHIVERHRGRLDIESTVGVGTTVTVLLPAASEETAALSSKSHADVIGGVSRLRL